MSTPTSPGNPQGEPPEPPSKDQPVASGGVPMSSTGGNDSAEGGTTAAGSYSSVDTPGEKPSGTTDDASAQGGESTAVAERGLYDPSDAVPPVPPTGLERTGMFGVHGSGDTSGYGGLVRQPYVPVPAERPYGSYFDEVADALHAAMAERSIPSNAIRQTTVAHHEITFYLSRDHLTAMLWALRDDPSLRFELLSSLSGVDYGPGVPQRLHVVYELTSMTYRRRIRVEVAVGVEDPYVPSAVAVYPTADWHERETWDMFGIVFSGHPALTRILMPDDWLGHPQRKDYPLGGIPVEYKGAEVPAPDQRRAYS
jgi:NADH-quinone oxidoreductase subunit C